MSDIFDHMLKVKTEHLDDFGHVNNVVYIQWMQDIATQHSAQLGLQLDDFIRLKHAMVAVEHHVQYRKAAFEGQELVMRTWLNDLNALYSFRQYVIFRPQDQQIIFAANTKWACVELATGRPKRMSPTFLQTYQILPADIDPYDFNNQSVLND